MYMGWSVMEEIPPGFRFYPTEEELVSFYLPQKLEGRRQDLDRVIPLLSVYDFNPWDLPQFVGELCRGDPEQWFFFVPRQEKETRGGRPSRLTKLGYWKATGSPGFVYSSSGRVIGEKRIMVFYRGRAPNGEKTEWKMNEYTAIDGEAASSSSTSTPPKVRRELSLCRVYVKSKCLRAFDRRPSSTGLVMINELGTSDDQRRLIPAPNHHNGDDHDQPSRHDRALISHDQYRRNRPNDDNDDRSSSSAGNHDIAVHHHDQIQSTGETGNYRVDDSSSSNDPLWEWEQLNWF